MFPFEEVNVFQALRRVKILTRTRSSRGLLRARKTKGYTLIYTHRLKRALDQKNRPNRPGWGSQTVLTCLTAHSSRSIHNHLRGRPRVRYVLQHISYSMFVYTVSTFSLAPPSAPCPQ